MQRFLGALRFLTVLPLPGRSVSPGEAALFFPLTGALLGASAGAVLLILSPGLGRPLSALLAIAWLLAATGCLHEDGLADVADALRAGRTREKMLAILKDSRIGTYGALALVLSIAVRWQALAQSAVNPVAGLAAALTLSRTSLVALAAFSPAAGTGMGQEFVAACTQPVMAAASVEALLLVALAAVFIGWRYAAAAVLAGGLVILLARFYFVRRLGGVNGDCLGAACQTVEAVTLVIFAWHPSF